MFELDSIGVYRIVAPSGSCYVGMTCDSFRARWSNHKKELLAQRHPNSVLTAAAAKYGFEALKFEVLESFEKQGSEDSLTTLRETVRARELFWWDKLKLDGTKLYNGRPNVNGSVVHTDESRNKISDSLRVKITGDERIRLQDLVDTCFSFKEAKNVTGFSKGALLRRDISFEVLIGNKYKAAKSRIKVSKGKSGGPRKSQRGIPKPRAFTPLPLEEIKALYSSGMSLKDIGVQYGITGPTVGSFLRRNGVQTRSRYEFTEDRLDKLRKKTMEEVRLVEDTVSKAAGD